LYFNVLNNTLMPFFFIGVCILLRYV
jgi:hypothetical protein